MLGTLILKRDVEVCRRKSFADVDAHAAMRADIAGRRVYRVTGLLEYDYCSETEWIVPSRAGGWKDAWGSVIMRSGAQGTPSPSSI